VKEGFHTEGFHTGRLCERSVKPFRTPLLLPQKEGEQKGSARGSVHWGCYYATALDIEVDQQRCCFGGRKSDFALQAVVECRTLEPECFRLVGLR